MDICTEASVGDVALHVIIKNVHRVDVHALFAAAEQRWLLTWCMKKVVGQSYWMRCSVREQKPLYWPAPTLSGASMTAPTVKI